ncbi:hypothetical protein FOMPIDRAFT_1126929 [Fomitopsis schrenkii]|uniref:Oxidoreductase n=1 Tax=Fomitopsis schrenkii TaxID=2126942 RepID=S8FIQ0_FOMSC|nr:hypothetical protein FOMPIDRAFT_1126929 [Fomitopsis schrenkii]
MFFQSKWDPRGRHCFITGGSSGLGLSLAVLLVRKGANVSIVARNEERLKKALETLEAARVTEDQILNSYSFGVNSEAGAVAAIEAASQPYGGRSPDDFFLCAGGSIPGYFVEQTEASMREGMEVAYWVQAASALAAAKRLVSRHEKGKIVFVSSVLAYFSIVGYSTYSPGKFALRGLAESLRSEFGLYGIDVHIAFPATIYTSGYERENLTKPKITLKIEEADSGATPDVVAAAVFKGVQSGDFHIAYDFIGQVFRASTAGASPRTGYLTDIFYSLVGYIALPIWRQSVDTTVRKHRQEHDDYLAARQYFKDAGSGSTILK